MALRKVYIGVPEDDELIEVADSTTVRELLEQESIEMRGHVQLNGRNLKDADLDKSLAGLKVANKDSIHVVRKLDGAQ